MELDARQLETGQPAPGGHVHGAAEMRRVPPLGF